MLSVAIISETAASPPTLPSDAYNRIVAAVSKRLGLSCPAPPPPGMPSESASAPGRSPPPVVPPAALASLHTATRLPDSRSGTDGESLHRPVAGPSSTGRRVAQNLKDAAARGRHPRHDQRNGTAPEGEEGGGSNNATLSDVLPPHPPPNNAGRAAAPSSPTPTAAPTPATIAATTTTATNTNSSSTSSGTGSRTNGLLFFNNAIGHAMSMMRTERARVDGGLHDDFAAILRGGAIYIPEFICREDDRGIFQQLKLEAGVGTSGSVIDWSRHELVENPDSSPTFNFLTRAMSEYFDVDVYATRLNYYADGTKWKTFHHDSHAYGGRALREDMTIGLSLGSSRELQFLHEPSGNTFSFPQPNGCCFAFTSDVNTKFMHGVPRSKSATGDRLSIIAWGRRRTLNARNGGATAGEAVEQYLNLQAQPGSSGSAIDSVEGALAAARAMVSASSARRGTAECGGDGGRPPSAIEGNTFVMSSDGVAPKKKKNRLQ